MIVQQPDAPTGFAETLTNFRKHRGLTVAGLAEKSGVGKVFVSAIENGLRPPTIESVWRLASALDLTFGDLLQGSVESCIEGKRGAKTRLIDSQSNRRQ